MTTDVVATRSMRTTDDPVTLDIPLLPSSTVPGRYLPGLRPRPIYLGKRCIGHASHRRDQRARWATTRGKASGATEERAFQAERPRGSDRRNRRGAAKPDHRAGLDGLETGAAEQGGVLVGLEIGEASRARRWSKRRRAPQLLESARCELGPDRAAPSFSRGGSSQLEVVDLVERHGRAEPEPGHAASALDPETGDRAGELFEPDAGDALERARLVAVGPTADEDLGSLLPGLRLMSMSSNGCARALTSTPSAGAKTSSVHSQPS